MKRIQIVLIALLGLYSIPLYANNIVGKVVRLLAIIPETQTVFRSHLRTTLERDTQLRSRLGRPSYRSDTLSYANQGIEIMAKEALRNRMIEHGVDKKSFPWQSQIMRILIQKQNLERRCPSCSCNPANPPCFFIPFYHKIGIILSRIPQDESALSADVRKVKTQYEEDTKTLEDPDAEEVRQTYAKIGIEQELTQQLEREIKTDLNMEENAELKKEAIRILRDDDSTPFPSSPEMGSHHQY